MFQMLKSCRLPLGMYLAFALAETFVQLHPEKNIVVILSLLNVIEVRVGYMIVYERYNHDIDLVFYQEKRKTIL